MYLEGGLWVAVTTGRFARQTKDKFGTRYLPGVPANSNMHVADGCRGAPTAKSEVAPGAGPGDRQGRPQVLYFVLVAHD